MTDTHAALRIALIRTMEAGMLGVIAATLKVPEGRLRAWAEGDENQLEESEVLRIAAQVGE